MQEMSGPESGNNVDARYRIILVVWFGILMSIGFIVLLTALIERPQNEKNNVLMIVLYGVSTLLIFASIVPKHKLLEQAVQKQQPQLVQTAYIITFSMVEVISLCGLMLYMATPDRTYYVSFISSVVLMLLHFPRRRHLMAATFKSQS